MYSQGNLLWLAIQAYNLLTLQKTKIILIVLSKYSFFEIFGFEDIMDFGEKLVKWQLNKNCLKVGGGLAKRCYILTTNTRFVTRLLAAIIQFFGWPF